MFPLPTAADQAAYLAALPAAGPLPEQVRLSARCPECGAKPHPSSDLRHVFATVAGWTVPVIGCSGAPLIPPTILGLPNRAWPIPHVMLARFSIFPYPGFDGTTVHRRLRLWRTGCGQITAMLTEPAAAPGTSITNAAAIIHARLNAQHPDERVRVIEHYPDSGGEHFDEVTVTGGHVTWRRLPADDPAVRVAAVRTVAPSRIPT